MAITTSKKHPYDLRKVTPERVAYLENRFKERASLFQDTPVIIGGGWSIPYMLRLYEKALALKGDQNPTSTIRSWIPEEITQTTNKYYRDHNGVLHLLCFEEDLHDITKRAEKHGLTLVHRKREVSGFGWKLEESIPVTPERIIEISKRKAKEWLTSNAVRLTNLKDVTGEDYYDLFIHHYVDNEGREVKRVQDFKFTREHDGMAIKQEELEVEAYKDKGLTIKLGHFQPLSFKESEIETRLANPYYLFQVKKRIFDKKMEKKKNREREVVDLQILDKILEFAGIRPVDEHIQSLREGL